MARSVKIAPSLLAADFARLDREIAEVEEYVDCLQRKSEQQIEALEELRQELECRADDDVSC